MAKVFAPNKHYSGVSATVNFVNGQGSTDDKVLLDWFRSKGYRVEDEAAAPPAGSQAGDPAAKGPTPEEIVRGLKRDDLVELAVKYGIEKPHNTKTEDLVLALIPLVAKEKEAK